MSTSEVLSSRAWFAEVEPDGDLARSLLLYSRNWGSKGNDNETETRTHLAHHGLATTEHRCEASEENALRRTGLPGTDLAGELVLRLAPHAPRCQA